MRNEKLIFGITGGSGSGKTSVSAMLAELGVYVIDTDVIAHKVTQKGHVCLYELINGFGSEILLADGTLDRKKLAQIAFSDKEKTLLLNKITHKHIKNEVLTEIESSTSEAVAIDGAVIIGSNIEPLCDFIVSVLADKETRIARIKQRDCITEEQALTRLAAQPNDSFYKENSKYIIYNDSDTDELYKKVCELHKEIKRYRI